MAAPGERQYNPIELKEHDQRIGENKAALDKSAENYEKAQVVKMTLAGARQAVENYASGPTQESRLALQKLMDVYGLGSVDKTRIVNGEILLGSGAKLSAELARAADPNPTDAGMNAAKSAAFGMGHIKETNIAFWRLADQTQQRVMDRHDFYEEWMNGHNSIRGARAAFEKANPPEVYVSRAVPYEPKTWEAAKAFPPGTRFVNPDTKNPADIYEVPKK